jgi:hypothetical protein
MCRVFHLDVAKVDQNVIYCSGYTRMFQVYVPNVSSRFPDVYLQVFYLDVANVFHTCEVFSAIFCKCFIHMFRVFQLFHTYVASVSSGYFKSRSGVAGSVSHACFMCFFCLQTYVVSITPGCFKSRSCVASLSSFFCCLTITSLSPPPPGAGYIRRPSSSSGC